MPKKGQQKGTPRRRAEFIESLRTLGDGDECVFWPWSDIRNDYVLIHVDGLIMRMHRWVYEQIHGVELPRGDGRGSGSSVVMHTCDVRACCRPSHLVLGTQMDNITDAVRKGRMRPRVGSGIHAKLTERDVDSIRLLAARDVSYRAIGEAFGVSAPTITDIVHGRTHVGRGHGKLTPSDLFAIRGMAARPGVRQAEIARAYNVSEATVSLIVNRKGAYARE